MEEGGQGADSIQGLEDLRRGGLGLGAQRRPRGQRTAAPAGLSRTDALWLWLATVWLRRRRSRETDQAEGREGDHGVGVNRGEEAVGRNNTSGLGSSTNRMWVGKARVWV